MNLSRQQPKRGHLGLGGRLLYLSLDSACAVLLKSPSIRDIHTANRIIEAGPDSRMKKYEEKHCHACGKEHGTSMAKPACLSCYRKYRNLLRAKG